MGPSYPVVEERRKRRELEPIHREYFVLDHLQADQQQHGQPRKDYGSTRCSERRSEEPGHYEHHHGKSHWELQSWEY